MRIIISLFMLLCLVIVSIPANAQAVTVGANCTIAWAANTEADLATYRVYGTLTSVIGVPISKTLDAPKTATSTTCLALGLQSGGTLSVQVDAVDALGNRSPKSIVVTAVQDATGPTQPTGVTITPSP